MESINLEYEPGCCGSGRAPDENKQSPIAGYITGTLLLAAIWLTVYNNLTPLTDQITHMLSRVKGFSINSHMGKSIQFFVYETPKVLMLLTLVVFGVGIIRSFFTPERSRSILAGKRESFGNILAAMPGIVTPFCSCSAVPLFLGFVTTGVPLGVNPTAFIKPAGNKT